MSKAQDLRMSEDEELFSIARTSAFRDVLRMIKENAYNIRANTNHPAALDHLVCDVYSLAKNVQAMIDKET